MQKRIAVVTSDPFLFQKILLSVRGEAFASMLIPEAAEATALMAFDKCIWDVDSALMPEYSDARFVSVGRADAMLIRPFSREALNRLICSEAVAPIRLGERRAYLYGEEIRLTELEFALLSRLMRERGEFVSREELLSDVWGDDADGGILNVYVHYLREKLEKRGEKIIISSRKSGYKIDEKYLKGEVSC